MTKIIILQVVVVCLLLFGGKSTAQEASTELRGETIVHFVPLRYSATNNITEKTALANSTPVATNIPAADVDINIPQTNKTQTHTYALVIGNEDYHSYNRGLSSEVDVAFARNDAEVFAQYCHQTLGIPQTQIRLLTNATAGQIEQGLDWVSFMAATEGANAELLFYYSGHGLPSLTDKSAYLIPVDVDGSNLKFATPLDTVLHKLTQHPHRRVTVFLDACFSGGARGSSLVAAKAVKIRPKASQIDGNLVMFSSSTDEETSGVYYAQNHGCFTYYLLRKLQESKGEIDYRNLADYLFYNVRKTSAIENRKQSPTVQCSLSVINDWETWQLK